jgi:hypothetical protein
VIAYLTSDKLHGLVASIEDVAQLFTWGQMGVLTGASNNETNLPTATPKKPYRQYYAGYQNQLIIAQNYSFNNYPAFESCADYVYSEDGISYTDWFLPSPKELQTLLNVIGIVNATSIAHGGQPLQGRYWSSSEDLTSDYAKTYDTANNELIALKSGQFSVRCIRAF